MKRIQANKKLIAVLIAASVICLLTIYFLFMAEGHPLKSGAPPSPTLVSPINTIVTDSTPELVWSRVNGATTYELEIVSQKSAKIVCSKKGLTPNNTSYRVQTNEALSLGVHHWRVRAVNAAGKAGIWSEVGIFTVQ